MSVPVFIKSLNNLKGILEKAEKFALEKKVAESVLLESRLYIDMFPLIKQIQTAGDLAKGTAARLAGMEPPKMEDNEKTFAELQTRLGKTVSFLETLKPEQFENSATAEIRLPYYPGKHFLGADYLPFTNAFWTDGGRRFFANYDPSTGFHFQSLPFYTSEWGMTDTGPYDIINGDATSSAFKDAKFSTILWIENISGLGILMAGTDTGVITLG